MARRKPKPTETIENPAGYVFHGGDRSFQIRRCKPESYCFCDLVVTGQNVKRDGKYVADIFMAGLTLNEAASLYSALKKMLDKEMILVPDEGGDEIGAKEADKEGEQTTL